MNREIKVFLLGDSAVGKTALMEQYVNKQFTEEFRATIAADWQQKEVKIDDKWINLEIWDYAGRECSINSVGKVFLKTAECCLLIFDLTNPQSLENLPTWKELLIQTSAMNPKDIPFILVGNKCDREAERKVSYRDAQTWAEDNGNIPYYETSAKEGTHIKETFELIARNAVKAQASIRPRKSFRLNADQVPKEKKGCCT